MGENWHSGGNRARNLAMKFFVQIFYFIFGVEQCFSTSGTCVPLVVLGVVSWDTPPDSHHLALRYVAVGKQQWAEVRGVLLTCSKKALPSPLRLLLVLIMLYPNPEITSNDIMVKLPIGGSCEVVWQGTNVEKRWYNVTSSYITLPLHKD